MAIFSPVTLDRFLEPGSHNLSERSPLVPAKMNQPIPRRGMSPALYTTPDTTLLPPDSQLSPSSFSPVSPYVLNYKRRISLPPSGDNSQTDASGGAQLSDANQKLVEEGKERNELMERVGDEVYETNTMEVVKEEMGDVDRESEADEFFEFNESLSITSEDASGVERSWKPSTSVGDFFDACEDTMSEGGVAPSNQINDIVDELREIRLTLLMEIEKKKQAEESLKVFQNQWWRLSHQLSLLGLNLPPPRVAKPESNENNENSILESDPVMELCQQISVSSLVSNAISKGISRAEVTAEMDSVIQAKNFEISRLMDRVQYYEAANREMSQRNQEAIEMTRQQRNRRRIRQKWFWASIGLAVTLGSAAIVWSYLPSSKPTSSEQKETPSAHK